MTEKGEVEGGNKAAKGAIGRRVMIVPLEC